MYVRAWGRIGAADRVRRRLSSVVILPGGPNPTHIPQKGWVVQPFGRLASQAARRPSYRNVRLGLVRFSPPISAFIKPFTRIVTQKAAARPSSRVSIGTVIQFSPQTFAPRWYIKT